jgi:squalene-hopene/tetraprenyl-beta-curcumene cyclase
VGRRMKRLAQGLLALLAACSVTQPTSTPAYDSAPVEWSAYEGMWVKDFPRASAHEPRLAAYDPGKAAKFLDDISLKFTRQNKCATCHTNVAYLMARPLIRGAGTSAATAEVRSLLLNVADEQLAKPTPFLPVYLAPIVSAVVIHDARIGGTMNRQVREMFDHLWSLQDGDGSWHYPTQHFLPLMERDFRYIAMLVALAVGFAPDHYYDTNAAKPGFLKLQDYIRSHRPENDHDRAVLLWASVRTPGLLNRAEQEAYQRGLLALQNRDGGWTLPALGTWPRHDGAPNDPHGPSDGYATALTALALCESGYGKANASIQRAMEWLNHNQRASGRWFTRSTYSNRFRNYLSNMATAYAIMAIDSCGGSNKG